MKQFHQATDLPQCRPNGLLQIGNIELRLSEIRKHNLTRTTLILVGEAIGSRKNRSRLYHTTHAHIFRRRGRVRKSPPA